MVHHTLILRAMPMHWVFLGLHGFSDRSVLDSNYDLCFSFLFSLKALKYIFSPMAFIFKHSAILLSKIMVNVKQFNLLVLL